MNTDTHKIVWLASYPKSGNTWFRIFLSNLLNKRGTPANINELEGGAIASSRILFDDATGLSSSDLTPEEIETLRPEVYRYIAAQSDHLIFHKIHDAFTITSEGVPLIPKDATHSVLYFIRNPLDVAVSFAHHSNVSYSKIIQRMNNNSFAFCSNNDKLNHQLYQKLLSWSNHIRSWVDQSDLPLMTIRYEDMKTKPFETFKNAISFLKLNYNDEEIMRAIQFSDFSIIKEQEEKNGFKEKAPGSNQFFRKGIIDSWKEELTPEEVELIKTQHYEMMVRFGYI
jgi:hypothetical protein